MTLVIFNNLRLIRGCLFKFENNQFYGGGSGLRLNDGFDVKLEIVGCSLMIVFGWTLRGLTNGFL